MITLEEYKSIKHTAELVMSNQMFFNAECDMIYFEYLSKKRSYISALRDIMRAIMKRVDKSEPYSVNYKHLFPDNEK